MPLFFPFTCFRNVCYEPNEVNPYLDVQLVLNLLFSALRHHNANTTVICLVVSLSAWWSVNHSTYSLASCDFRTDNSPFASIRIFQLKLARLFPIYYFYIHSSICQWNFHIRIMVIFV